MAELNAGSGRVIGAFSALQEEHGGVSRSVFGVDCATLRPAPRGHLVRIEGDPLDSQATGAERLNARRVRGNEGRPGGMDLLIADSGVARIVFRARPEEGDGLHLHGDILELHETVPARS